MITINPVRFSGSSNEQPRKRWINPSWKEKVAQARQQGKDFLEYDPDFNPAYIKYVGPFYRMVGQSELDKVMAGETVHSTCYNQKRAANQRLTNITNSPNYLGGGNQKLYSQYKYRISFKETEKFDPGMLRGLNMALPHTTERNAPGQASIKFLLYGGYNLEDVKKIDYCDDHGVRQVLYEAPLLPQQTEPDQFIPSTRINTEKKEHKEASEQPDAANRWKQRVSKARQQGLDYLPIDPKLNIRPPYIKYEGPFYRFIGQAELDKVMAGERVSSPLHHGKKSDVTNHPNYLFGLYGQAEYRISFKENDQFDPAMNFAQRKLDQPHTVGKNTDNHEYYLKGGYTLGDIEKIDRIDNKGNWQHFYSAPKPPLTPLKTEEGTISQTSEPDIPITNSVVASEENPDRTPKCQTEPQVQLTSKPKLWSELSLMEKIKRNWNQTTHKTAFNTILFGSILCAVLAVPFGPAGLVIAPLVIPGLIVGLLPFFKALFNKEIGQVP